MDIEKIAKEQLINKLVELNQKITFLKKYEEESSSLKELLVESNGKYESLLGTNSVGIIIIDNRGIITACNDAALDFSGYSREELIGKYFTKRVNISTKDIPGYIEIFKAILDGKEVNSFEITQHRKNGNVLFGEVYFGLLKNEGNKIIGFKVIIKDITEKKKLEDKFLEGKEKLDALFKSSLIGIVIHDNGKILEVNDAFTDMFGCNHSYAVGRNLLEFVVPEYKETMLDKIKSGYDIPYIVEGIRSTRSKIFVEVTGRSITHQGEKVG